MMLNENFFLDEANKNKVKKKKKNKTDYSIPQSKFKTIDDIIKFHKKRQKGQGSFVTYDVGNMDYNNALFNKGMGSDGGAITSGGTSADGAVSFAGGISNGGVSAGSSNVGVGMGESLELKENDTHISVSDPVKKYLEDNISKLEKDPKAFLIEILDNRFDIGLSKRQKGELVTLLHSVGVDVTKDVLDMLAYDYFYFNPDTKNNDQDYIDLLEDLVENVPNRYVDSNLYSNKNVGLVYELLECSDPIEKNIIDGMYVEDTTQYVEDVRVETSLNKWSGIELKIVMETDQETAELKINPFPNIYLGSYGYIIDKEEANNRLDLIKQFVEEALSK